MFLINRLTKITNDLIVQGTGPVDVIGVSSHENCWNRMARLEEASVELDSAHRRHVDVGDQAACFEATRRCEEIGCRRADSTGYPNDLMSLLTESRKYRSSSTTETNDVFGISSRQLARAAAGTAPNNVVRPQANSVCARRYRPCDASGP
jgi:hypothetical protein